MLLGTDFSAVSAPAFDEALRICLRDGSPLVIVHALQPLGAPGLRLSEPTTHASTNEGADITASGADMLPGDTAATAWVARARRAGVACRMVGRPGRPARAILEEAAACNARLIVTGTHEREGTARDLFGSVSNEVALYSPVPVLAVPAARDTGEARGWRAWFGLAPRRDAGAAAAPARHDAPAIPGARLQ